MPMTTNHPKPSSKTVARDPATGRELQPLPDLQEYALRYAKEKPEVVAMWCFGVGFVLGWKLKPW